VRDVDVTKRSSLRKQLVSSRTLHKLYRYLQYVKFCSKNTHMGGTFISVWTAKQFYCRWVGGGTWNVFARIEHWI